VLNEKDDQGLDISMNPAQVKGIQVLLDRVLPTLSSQDLNHHSDIAQEHSENELIQMTAEALGLTEKEIHALLLRKNKPQDVVSH